MQGAIFPGVEVDNRKEYLDEYIEIYGEEPIRTITIIYDLVGLLQYIVDNELSIGSTHELLNNNNISFEGLDGKFSFADNLVTRDLKILKILNGKANLVK